MKLIILHGLGQTVASYDDLKNSLTDVEVDVLELPKAKNFEHLCSQLRNRLQQESESFVLFGLSLGGVLALALANHLPQCRGLVVSGAQYRLEGNWLFGLQIAIMSLLPKSFYHKRELDKEQLLSLQKSMCHLDLTTEVSRIILPTLLICGAKDKPNLKPAYELNKLIPQAELVIIEGGGHELNVHKPTELAQAIKQFLKRYFS
ncbi:TPA: alpha/beta fold hydrolase [Streptococcus suis]|uniref:alpha/beta fold hydrolase n=1 Tax=Streptococcus suis TaxID=1307 RepID=UPI00040874A6|nr:alpha/beta hydrolase [Streptococcus suis]HEM3173292.1 alpha/beta fold hydrolase [Streptococcus suis]HEM4060072.1 alpha/beta fold hydrolase [Streptococcus suis]